MRIAKISFKLFVYGLLFLLIFDKIGVIYGDYTAERKCSVELDVHKCTKQSIWMNEKANIAMDKLK